ncbi:MAG: putative DNA binding domain-containing protein [Atopobiaceae bacterium]|nr:putative DNA binding domain-containing protein [Atopobiaceae bacterium]
MTENELISLLDSINERFETEILELKEADNGFKVRDLGIYFSALSNEANLRDAPRALLIFGVNDKGVVVGTSFYREPGFPERRSKGLQRLKKQLAENTNNRITFREIHELDHHGKRIVAFEIPPATRGIPTQWAGAAWAREGESLVPLPLSKIDEIRAQPPRDWAKLPAEGAGMEDLDPDALYAVRESMRNKYGERSGLIDSLDDGELLDKAGITIRGRITNAALLLLGREEASVLMDGPVPRITWTLYESDGRVRAYEHFGPPFALSIDGVLAKIRNERYRIMDDPSSLKPTEVMEYDPWTLRELLGNALAHQDYASGRRINVGEYADRICVSNSGSFIPGSLEQALEPGYKPSYYRNPFLCDAMQRRTPRSERPGNTYHVRARTFQENAPPQLRPGKRHERGGHGTQPRGLPCIHRHPLPATRAAHHNAPRTGLCAKGSIP